MKKLIALLLCLVMVLGLAACGGDTNPTDGPTEGPTSGPTDGPDAPTEPEGPAYTITEFDPNATYTWNDFVGGLSTNWNPLDYEDNNSSNQFGPLMDVFYQGIFNDELHPMSDAGRTPYDGYVYVPAMAADYPVDVTEQVKAEHPDWIPADATSGYAWAITLRDDLYFDTGYHITADTVVESVKRLLDPRLQNYRAVDFYQGGMGVVGAEAYANDYSGQMNYDDNGITGYSFDSMTKDENGQYTKNGFPVYIPLDSNMDWLGGTLREVVEGYGDEYFGMEHWEEFKALADEQGLIPATDENLALLATVTTTNPNWGESEADLPNYVIILKGVYPDELVFEDTVAFWAEDEYTFVQVLKSAVNGFYLYYGGLKGDFIVEPDVYDASLSQDDQGIWTSNYMTSVETSPSFGPYSMKDYQTEKLISYTKNDKWYGWHDDVNHVYKDPNDGNVYRMNQSTDIVYQVVTEPATQKSMFLNGELMGYGLETEDLAEYRNSEFCYYSPGLGTLFLQLTGNMEGIQARENAEGFDKTKQDLEIITLKSFRQAFALSYDREDYCATIAPNRTGAIGLIGPAYVCDPDNVIFYRDTDQAKQVLCDFYAVDTSKYASLDEAVDSITGYNPDAAREYYKQAFEEGIELGYITDEDNDGICDQDIILTYTLSGQPNSDSIKRLEFMNTKTAEVTTGTPFEGKISFVNSAPLGSGKEFSDAIKNGAYDWSFSGWTGAQMNPYNLLTAYVLPSNAYANAWYDTTEDMVTINIGGEDITLSVYDWVMAVNGSPVVSGGVTYNFGSNDADADTRLTIMAAVEKALLMSFNYIPFMLDGSLALLSQQVYYVIDDYNPVMGRGSMEYIKYNYSDAEWAEYVDEQIAEHGHLQY